MAGTTAWVLGDQLSADLPSLEGADRVVMVESTGRATRRVYHRRKLVLLFSAMRHRAAELTDSGLDVDYRRGEGTLGELRAHVDAHRPDRIVTAAASEWRGRGFQQRLEERLGVPVEVVPNTQMLVERHAPVDDPGPDTQVVMERFYRAMRRHHQLLIDPDGEPEGGEWNFDRANRKPYPKRGLSPPAVPSFTPDETTEAVMAEVAERPGLGSVDGFDLAVTRAQAAAALGNFVAHRLESFGPYEDAMTATSATLYHSLLSPLLNLGLLDPLDCARAAERAYREGRAPIESVEGFIRQVVGWREFMWWSYWRLMPALADANAWDHHRDLPEWWWTGDTEMRCLSTVIRRVLDTGYSHHIERLMILCNYAMLAGIEPQQVNEWFLSCYVDAYEWVVTPNVIGMGLNADGGVIATKPYISSARYIDKMSDYCGDCRYDPGQRVGEEACPFNVGYWAFLHRNEKRLRANPRLGPAVLGLRHLTDAERTHAVDQADRLFMT